MSLPVETEHSAWLIFASICALISLADLLLNLLRQRSRSKDDVESLAAIGIATLPHHDQRSTMIDDDRPDDWIPGAHTDPWIPGAHTDPWFPGAHTDPWIPGAHTDPWIPGAHTDPWIPVAHTDPWFPGARADPSIGIRRRIRHQQEVPDETSIEDQSVKEESIPYSMARYLNAMFS